MVTTNDDPPEFPDEISTSSSKRRKLCDSLQPWRISSLGKNLVSFLLAMVTTNDDPPEFPDEISTSSSKRPKLCDSLQPCGISSVQFLEELLYEIFLRLPVKSLIRFRCVSKGMRRLIDSPIFIKNHNNMHRYVISERDRSLSVSDDEEDYAILLCQSRLRRLFSVDFDKDDNNNLNRAKAIVLDSTFAQEGRMEFIGGGCNGIFFFGNSQCYVIWNPSNGTFRKVVSSSCLISANVSMGYDCVNDDYKLIRFIMSEASLEVYSFRKDSWRKIPRDDFPPRHYCYTSAVCLGGVIHWIWFNSTDKSMSIAGFDLATETFTWLALPLEAIQLQLRPSHFTDFRGRLCVTFLPPTPRRSRVPQTIWVMENYGVESSWSKLYTSANTSMRIGNFYFPNMKRRLLCIRGRLSWWDPQDGSFEDIEIPGLLNDQAFIPELYLYDSYIYVRNLVRLDQTLV